MNEKAAAVHQQLEALRDSYRDELPGKIDEVQQALDKINQAGWETTACKTLHRLVHTLAGTSATFKLSAVSQAACKLSDFLKPLVETGEPPGIDQYRYMDGLVEALKQSVNETAEDVPEIKTVDATPLITQTKPEKDRHLIFLVQDDKHLAEVLSVQLGRFGHEIRTFSRPKKFLDALKQELPDAVIIDMIFPEGSLAGVEAVKRMELYVDHHIPTIFISHRDDITVRLQAVRAGGDAYFTKPVDVDALSGKLSGMLEQKTSGPYRIMIVDDSESLSQYYALVLGQAGMKTQISNDPMQALELIEDFNPELILMDIYMPGCSGDELAKIIRQLDRYVDVPIVFVSQERDKAKQLASLMLGGDDFITKPVQDEHLVSSVTSRAQRHRILRSLMTRDSLTGLLNHTRVKNRLENEVARAERQASSFVFAMLDIDNFKSVNDTYGHPTGDKVLKSLSRLLTQRLRKSDVVGRYGGEEFAIILPETTPEQAHRVLDELRMDFAAIMHQHNNEDMKNKSFHVTFSCGIAAFPGYEDATCLNDAADNALYAAKEAGRNTVVLAKD